MSQGMWMAFSRWIKQRDRSFFRDSRRKVALSTLDFSLVRPVLNV